MFQTLADSSSEDHIDLHVTIADKYRLKEKIGEGSFGEVYAGYDIKTNHPVAIKIAIKNREKNLVSEADLYNHLNFNATRSLDGTNAIAIATSLTAGTDATGIPKMYWAGYDGEYYFLVLEKLGDSLQDLIRHQPDRVFKIATVATIACQGLRMLEYIHHCGIIHRDMKPSNFLFGINRKRNQLYLVDFGLAKYYRDLETNEHLPDEAKRRLVGTAKFVSSNVHNGQESSRRDDLESFGYVLIYLARGELPWGVFNDSDKAIRYDKIKKMKSRMPLTQICKGLPNQFLTYLQYCRALDYDSDPNYRYLRSIFALLK